jgi:hypothetical protein
MMRKSATFQGKPETGNQRNTLLFATVANNKNNQQVFTDQSVDEIPMLLLFPAPMRIFFTLCLVPLLHNSSLFFFVYITGSGQTHKLPENRIFGKWLFCPLSVSVMNGLRNTLLKIARENTKW